MRVKKWKKPSFSKTKRAQIVILHEERFSQRNICKKLSYSRVAFYEAIARFQNFRFYHDKKRNEIAKKKSPFDNNLIRRIAVWSPTNYCEKIPAALLLKGTDVYRTTIRRSRRLVHNFNLKAFEAKKNLV